jgi:hypothetical protein
MSPAPPFGPDGVLMLWSAPRCRSTMFLRMMAQRGDFATVHEPLSRVKDFGRSAVLDRECTTADDVIREILALGRRRRVFVKDTTDFHFPEVLHSAELLSRCRHTFVIRDLNDAIASHFALNPALTRDEVGFARLREIYDAVTAATGTPPVVIDSDDLVVDPPGVVRRYCEAVGIEFIAEALRWPRGGLPEWELTARWHEHVANSEGIESHHRGRPDLRVAMHPLLGAYYRFHVSHHRHLWDHRLRV